MSVLCRRARVAGLGELYLVVTRYSYRLERVETFTDGDSARLYAQLCAQRMNRHWNFTVLTVRLPAEMEGTVYSKHIQGLD